MKIAIAAIVTFVLALVLGFTSANMYHAYQAQQQQQTEAYVQEQIAKADANTPSVQKVVVNGEAK